MRRNTSMLNLFKFPTRRYTRLSNGELYKYEGSSPKPQHQQALSCTNTLHLLKHQFIQAHHTMNPVNAKPYALPPDAIWLSTAPHTLHPSHYPNTQSTNNPVTGCSSGIGQSLAALLASKPNQRLIATARNPSTLSYLPDSPNILKLALDVTSPSSVDAAFATAAEHFGDEFHLDVVVNNAGYSLSGDTEAAAEEEAHLEMETLFFGTARVTTRALPIMRKEVSGRRGGVIFNISSLAGLCGFPGHAYYHAGKFAVEGWSESVAREVHPNWNGMFFVFVFFFFFDLSL